MIGQWTADVVGQMHINRITAKRLAEEIGWHPKYLSQVLNGHKAPKSAESKVRKALANLISRKNTQ